MSFRIDLSTKNGVNIFLVVVRNTINMNFVPCDDSTSKDVTYIERSYFVHLLKHFKLKQSEVMVRGEDPEHVKRHHGYAGETEITHAHSAFDQDVTPQILTQFLQGILQAQKEHSAEGEYQFIDDATAARVLEAFTVFHREFTGSAIQEQFLEERQLTKEEKDSLMHHSIDSGFIAKTDKPELQRCGFDTDKVKPVIAPSMNEIINFLFFSPNLFQRPTANTTAMPSHFTITT